MKRLFTSLFLLGSASIWAQCGSTVQLSASAGTNNTSLGSIGWSGFANIIASDNTYCSAGSLLGVLATANTQYLFVSGFGFNLPAGATVCGIEASVERNASGLLIGSSVRDNSVKIAKGGTITGTDHASSASWTGSDVIATYGGNGDAWGTSWTYADINNASFGIAISAQLSAGLASLFLSANIDQVKITVYYTDVVLPIELTSFTAVVKMDEVELHWVTASETNNDYFSLQKLKDTSWVQIATCDGSGTTTQVHTYSLRDMEPAEVNYYRLVQYDYNGMNSGSDVIAVEYTNTGTVSHKLSVYPQPAAATDRVTVSGEGTMISLEIYTNEGTLVQSEAFADGNTRHELNTAMLKPGVYLVRVYFQDGGSATHRLLII